VDVPVKNPGNICIIGFFNKHIGHVKD